MEGYKREFIQFLESAGVFKFGDFTAKSGRKSLTLLTQVILKQATKFQSLVNFMPRHILKRLAIKKPYFTALHIRVFPLQYRLPAPFQKRGWMFPSSLTVRRKRTTVKAAFL